MRLQEPLSVVTPTVDGAVLQVLGAADRAFTTSEVTNLIQRSPAGVRLVLNRLTREGLVDLQRVGPTFTYRLNRDHLAAEAVMALSGLKATFVQRLRDELATWTAPPAFAALFGSAARGDMTEESDIDVLLVVDDEGESRLSETEQLASRVRRWTGNDCRPLLLTVGVVEEHAASDPALTQIAEQGIPLVGDPYWLRRQVKRGRRRVRVG